MLEQILQSTSLIKPEVILTVLFCVLILIDLVMRKESYLLPVVALIGVGLAAYFVVTQSGQSNSVFSNMLAIDPFSQFFKLIVLASTASIILFSLHSDELRNGKRGLGEYYALLIALSLGMILMTGASNLIMMYLSLELASISSYILSGFTKDADDSSEASLKYVIFGSVSSGLMLYGISILYGLTGSLDIYGINQVLMHQDVNTAALILAGVLMLVGFGYKISAVPFHFWTPDVYEGAPITITALLSVASKAAGFAMMIRFFKVSFLDPTIGGATAGAWVSLSGFEWNHVLAALAVVTMTLGNFVALWQNNLKRMLAYSSIAHAGYMLLGLVVLSNDGIAAVLVYFAVYFFMNLGAFYTVMLVANKTGSEDIEAYNGLGYRSPFISAAFTIFLLSLTGIPPTAGFVGKLYLFAALLNGKWILLAIIGVLNSVVSLYYYVRILRNMYLKEPEASKEPISFSVIQLAILLLFLIPTILLGLYFGPLVEYAQASVTMFGVR